MKISPAVVVVTLGLAACIKQESAPAEAALRIHYDVVATCTRMLGAEGGYIALRIVRIENDTSDQFAFEPARLRVIDNKGTPHLPLLFVPEFSELEVPAHAARETEETQLLQYRSSTSDLAWASIHYDRPGALMVRIKTSEPTALPDCDGYAT